MNYLLDTCVISEYTRRKPSQKVIRWVAEADEDSLFLSVLTIGELQHGIERLPNSPRKLELADWLQGPIIARFNRRLVGMDSQTMLVWGSLTARLESQGHPLPLMDSLIAATALCHSFVLVTRNVEDFLPAGVQMMNPWE